MLSTTAAAATADDTAATAPPAAPASTAAADKIAALKKDAAAAVAADDSSDENPSKRMRGLRAIFQVKRLSEHAVLPRRGSPLAAGYDLCRLVDTAAAAS